MTSNYQRALYNGFKLKEQWNAWSKYIKRVYIVVYDARWNVYFGNLISLFSIINMNTLLEEWIHSLFALPSDIDWWLLTQGAPDQAGHVAHGAPELDAAVPHVGAHSAAPAHGTGGVATAPAAPTHALHPRLVPQRRQQPPQLPRLIEPHQASLVLEYRGQVIVLCS